MTIDLPIVVPLSGKKNWSLNLNNYRNAHFHTLSRAKKVFAEIVMPTLPRTKFSRVILLYTLYPKTKHEQDTTNVCSIVDKFFSDCLVANGNVTDDNYNYVPLVASKFGEIDKLNPRVTCEIIEISTTNSSLMKQLMGFFRSLLP